MTIGAGPINKGRVKVVVLHLRGRLLVTPQTQIVHIFCQKIVGGLAVGRVAKTAIGLSRLMFRFLHKLRGNIIVTLQTQSLGIGNNQEFMFGSVRAVTVKTISTGDTTVNAIRHSVAFVVTVQT